MQLDNNSPFPIMTYDLNIHFLQDISHSSQNQKIRLNSIIRKVIFFFKKKQLNQKKKNNKYVFNNNNNTYKIIYINNYIYKNKKKINQILQNSRQGFELIFYHQ